LDKTGQGFVGQFNNGEGWYCYPTQQFKTILIQAFWVNPLKAETASRAAIIPHILRRACHQWPTTVAMERRLEDLYGASFRAEIGKVGDQQMLSFQFEAVNGKFLPEHPDMLQQGIDFLREVLYRPLIADQNFDRDIFDQEKEILSRQIQALINDKGQYALNRLVATMAQGQGFGINRLGTLEATRSLSLDGLYEYYEEIRNSRPMVWFVVGDVDPEAVKRVFDHDPAMGRTREALPSIPRFVAKNQGKVVVERQAVQQGKVNLGYFTGITAQDQDYPALVMYAGILGGFPHSKLFIHVREEASLAYYCYARLDGALGLMVIGAGIEFDDYDAATAIIHQQVDLMRQGEISDEEMAFTLSALSNEIMAESDSPSQIIGRQLEHLLVGGGLSGRDLIDALGRVTREDIQRVATRVSLDTTYFLTNDHSDSQPGEGGHAK
jgi:predicted Zn-dependent peptidase